MVRIGSKNTIKKIYHNRDGNIDLWLGSFWNFLIYPESSLDETYDPEVNVSWVYEHLLKRRYPDFVVSVSLDNLLHLPSEDRAKLICISKRIIHDLLPKDQCKLLGFAHNNSLYFCGNLPMSTDEEKKELFQRLNLLIDTLRNRYSLSATIGVAFLPDYSVDSWRWAAQRAVVAQREKVKRGEEKLYVYSDSPSSSLHLIPQDIIRILWDTVNSGNISEVERVSEIVIQELFEKKYFPLIYLRTILQFLTAVMGWAGITAGADITRVFEKIQDYLSEINNTYDYLILKRLVEEELNSFTLIVWRHYSSSFSDIISNTKDFISTHLSETITLKLIAEKLGVNPSYLSRKFKQKEGITLTTYINMKRIEEAKRLLISRNSTITDVAFDVGFGSIQQFNRVFKKIEGCSPSRWMANIVKNK